MSAASPRESAKIYAFVPRARPMLTGQGPARKPSDDHSTHQQPVCEFGGGWYHDAAIQEADRTRRS
ncbi:DUF2735 domain-containing protein [uncultured Methylobacterium sp.]|uniref:DUF2735 domain-containing protein n=1 Tax=uncultured Methylobacterium sp. TaxID=157278 RepID=UPI0035CA6FF1